MVTPRQFEEQMVKAVEDGDSNTDIIVKCIGVMAETLTSLGYESGVEILKAYTDFVECK